MLGRRILLCALAVLAGCAFWPPPLAAVQNFLASDTVLTTGSQTTVLEQEWLVTSSTENFFVLANVRAFNQANTDIQLILTLSETSAAAFAPQTIVVLVPAAHEYTYQIPTSVSGLSLGPYQARLSATAASANAIVLQTETYLGVFNSMLPVGVVVDINGLTCAVQAFEGDADGSLTIDSTGCVHTFNTTAASQTQPGIVTTSAQTLGDGVKTFPAGIVTRQSSVGKTTKIGGSTQAAGIGDIAIGDLCQANGGGDGDGAICLGTSGLAIGADTIGIGQSLDNTGAGNTCIGHNHTCTADGATVLGKSAHAEGDDCLAAGISATCTADFGTAVGGSSQTTESDATCVGNLCTATAAQATGLGASVSASEEGCVALGYGAGCAQAGEFVVGSATPLVALWRPGAAVNTDLGSGSFPFNNAFFTGWNNDSGDRVSLDAAGNLVPDDPAQAIGRITDPWAIGWFADIRNTLGFPWSERIDMGTVVRDSDEKCGIGIAETTAGGPRVVGITCQDDTGATMGGVWLTPSSWNAGPITLSFVEISVNATPSGVLAFDVKCQCKGSGELASSTYGTAVALDTTFSVQAAVERTTSASMTCAGTCAAGDVVFWRATVDATTTTTEVADTAVIGARIGYDRGPSFFGQ